MEKDKMAKLKDIVTDLITEEKVNMAIIRDKRVGDFYNEIDIFEEVTKSKGRVSAYNRVLENINIMIHVEGK